MASCRRDPSEGLLLAAVRCLQTLLGLVDSRAALVAVLADAPLPEDGVLDSAEAEVVAKLQGGAFFYVWGGSAGGRTSSECMVGVAVQGRWPQLPGSGLDCAARHPTLLLAFFWLSSSHTPLLCCAPFCLTQATSIWSRRACRC